MTELTIKICGPHKSGKSSLAEALVELLRAQSLQVELKDTTRKYCTADQLLMGLRDAGTKIVVVGGE